MIDIVVDGIVYKSSEHYYMSEKTTDDRKRLEIMNASTAAEAKRLGKKLKLRPDWEEKYKNQSMLRGLITKFDIPEMRDKLVATGDQYLEETDTWNDVYWGVCNGVGKNMLGRMLMYIRGKYVTI
jgi:ribA/ribD-fused uncharacterized protein